MTPISLIVVPEEATHIAFVNGKTYSREEIETLKAQRDRFKTALENIANPDNLDMSQVAIVVAKAALAERKVGE